MGYDSSELIAPVLGGDAVCVSVISHITCLGFNGC